MGSAAPAGEPEVVIAHDFAETYGGAERVLAVIAERYRSAEVWAILARREVAERMDVGDRMRTLLPSSAPLMRHYRALAPAYPALVRARRLPAADVLVTSSYAFASGFQTTNGAPQLCYCHSPLRFAWSMTGEYGRRLGGPAGERALRGLARGMRRIDRGTAARVTRFVANSRFVAEQIRSFYGRDARVIRPPVDTSRFRPAVEGAGGVRGGHYLLCGRLVEPYKRPSLAIEAFRGLDAELVVAGDGPAMAELREGAPANVRFTGHLDDDALIPLMQQSEALVFPSQDDFGLLPIEVMACGRPVLAFAAGGALETVVPGRTGELFREQTPAGLRSAIRAFAPDRYDPDEIRIHAESFGVGRFRDALHEEVLAAAGGRRS